MQEMTTVGLDVAKNVFQVHGCDGAGTVLLRKKLRRVQLFDFFSKQPPCTVAMQACASSHYWGLEIGSLGHIVKLILPVYVKPFVKRQKNDAAYAEAIYEAVLRPTMRFVAVKSQENQASAIVFRARDLLVRQRTQIINALRGHLAESGMIVAQDPPHVSKLTVAVQDTEKRLPDMARPVLEVFVEVLCALDQCLKLLNAEIARRSSSDDHSRNWSVIALTPAAETFKRGRDFAAWLGLTPLQYSTGGKQRPGKTSKMGERTLRRLLIIGASAVIRWAARKGSATGSWLANMLKRKSPMLVRVVIFNG